MLEDCISLDYVFLGQPMCRISPPSLDTYTLDYAHLAQPFVAEPSPQEDIQPIIWITT